MEMVETLNNVVVLNEQPEFVAMSRDDISANFFILCENNSNGTILKDIHEYKVAGMSILNWVVRACEKQPIILQVEENADVLDVIRPYANDADYSVVLYANTPLVNKGHIKDLLTFVDRKRMNACKLKKGYVLRNEYILGVDELYSIDTYDFASDDFYEVKSLEDLSYVQGALLKKVTKYMQKNGVYFENANMVTVDALADVGYGTSVASNVSILGGCVIGDSVELDTGSVISGSKIGDNVKIGKGAYVLNSIVKNDAVIEDGAIIKNSVIGSNSVVGVGAKVLSSGFKTNARIGNFSVVVNSKYPEPAQIADLMTIKNNKVGA